VWVRLVVVVVVVLLLLLVLKRPLLAITDAAHIMCTSSLPATSPAGP
jgi:hypothetical protein